MEKSIKILDDILKKVADKQGYDQANIIFKQMSSGGANYTSYIFAAVISSKGKEDLKLFAKIAAMGPQLRSIAEHIYKNEALFYTDLMKVYRNLEDSNCIAIENRLRTAKYYGCSIDSGLESLVLEDLTASGFQTFDRLKSLTWEQAAESIGEMTKFHALSLALSNNKPNEFAMFKQLFSSELILDFYKSFIQSISGHVIDATEDKNKERIKNFVQNVVSSENVEYFVKPIKIETLIHADFKPNNLMYRYENGKYQVVPLDLQNIRCGSPTYDILYFISSGTDIVFLRKYFQDTLDFYYSELCTALGRLNLDPNEVYSREDFEYELREMLPLAVAHGLCGLLVTTVDEDDIPKELESIGPGDFAFTPSQHFRRKLNEFIEFYIEIGVIQ